MPAQVSWVYLFLKTTQLSFFSYVCSLGGHDLGRLAAILVKLWQSVLQRTEKYSVCLLLINY